MRFFGALAEKTSGWLSGYGANSAVSQIEARRPENLMQAAYDAALAAADGGEVRYSDVCQQAEMMGISAADWSDLSDLKIKQLTFDPAGVDYCGGKIDISGLTADQITFRPYTTAARVECKVPAAEIGELVCVGYKDQALVEMPPLRGISVGQVTCIAEDGGAPHNIALAFQDCAIGNIKAAGGTHMSLTANNCHIQDANFEGAKAAAINVNGGTLGGCFDKISIAPNSTGIRDATFTGTMQNAAGYTSLEGTHCHNPEAFAGTDLPRFDLSGARIAEPSTQPPEAQCSNADRLLDALEQAHNMLGSCGVVQAESDIVHAADLVQQGGIGAAELHATNANRVVHDVRSMTT